MRFNYLDFILFHIFFLATLSVQAKYFNDSTLSKDAVELDMHTKEINGLKLLHLWQSLDQDSLAINPDVVFIMAGKNDIHQLHNPQAEHTFSSNYQKIISSFKQKGIETVLFNFPPLTIENNDFNIPDHSDQALNPGITNRIAANKAYEYLVKNKKLDKKLKVLFLTDAPTKSEISTWNEQEKSIQFHFSKLLNWQKIAPYFKVPDKYKGDRGSFRDPFTFDDQSKVTSLEDWKKRRNEILTSWHAYMGEWPKFIENPNYEVLY